MEILDAARMRAADRYAIEECRIPSLVLMENAGRSVAEVVVERYAAWESRRIVILIGPGNNGGDGLVIARHLSSHGLDLRVIACVNDPSAASGDLRTMADAWRGFGGSIELATDQSGWEALDLALGENDLIIDALYGTGLARSLDGYIAWLVAQVNHSGARIVAVDVPSGVDASRSQPIGNAISADLTVTFARPKPALLLPPVDALSGEWIVAEIGIPARAIESTKPDLFWATAELIAALIPQRQAEDHKGDYGHVVVVGGSPGKSGAAALCGWAVLQAGAGLCTVATARSLRSEVAGFAPELMTHGLPETSSGTIGTGSRDAVRTLGGIDVLAVGPGLGSSRETTRELDLLLADERLPVVLDADGLNCFAGRPTELARSTRTLVITPHPGEAARLLGITTREIQAERVLAARRLAEICNAICVLKGHRTIVAAPDGHALINSTGNPGMATGGMGDVLTGLIAGYLAQGLDPFAAASLAVYLHGAAGDLAIEQEETEATLSASALLRHLAAASRRLESRRDTP
jgi:NAD(P)H-hydrate epimerase